MDRQTTEKEGSAISTKAKMYALQLFNEYGDARMTYHNFRQASEVNALVARIGADAGVSAQSLEAAEICSWFYLTGYLLDVKDSRQRAKAKANEFLLTQKESASLTQEVNACFQSLEKGNIPRKEAAEVFSDAVNCWSFAGNFEEKSALLRLELELFAHEQYSKADWTQYRLQQILGAKLYTSFAKENYEIEIGQNLLKQKALVEKSRNSISVRGEEENLRVFERIEKQVPERAIQTFFRTSSRNHINLSQIADNKANIMISVNAILISVVISVVSYQNITERHPAILAPVIIFVIAGLASLLFAVLSARPSVTSLNKGRKTKEEVQKNLIYFGNFIDLEVEQYEEAMDAVLRDSELMYGNMTRDLYYLGKVLDKKYRLLTISYNIFMVGFATTVFFFLIALLFN